MRCVTFCLNVMLFLLLCICIARGHVLQRREIQAAPIALSDQIPVTVIQDIASKSEALKAEANLEEPEKQALKKDVQLLDDIKQEQPGSKPLQPEVQLERLQQQQQLAEKQEQFTAPEPTAAVDSSAESQSSALQSTESQSDESASDEQLQKFKQLPESIKNQEAEKVPKIPADQDQAQLSVRQATQATPTLQGGSTTQQNFVQQLIQNTPIGQFLNQLGGQQQQQQQQQQQLQQQQQAPGEQPATPAPTVPVFLNPSLAITTAQQAVQSVVNATSQALQGVQQFATSLGNQFQNTLSGFTGQQQNTDATTARPPGPIQSFVTNLIGGNNATADGQGQAPQQQGPFQGIINFLAGGNRPQSAATAASDRPAATEKPIDNKVDTNEIQEQDEASNEVRNSGEIAEDSLEDAAPAEDVIVVNDDVEQYNKQPSEEEVSAPEEQNPSQGQGQGQRNQQ